MFSLYKKISFLNIPWTRFFQVGIYNNNVGISKVRNARVLDLYQVGGTLRLENFVHEKFGRLAIPFPNLIYSDLLTYCTGTFDVLRHKMRQNAWILLMYPWKTWVVDHSVAGSCFMLALCCAEVLVIHPKADIGSHEGRRFCEIDWHRDIVV